MLQRLLIANRGEIACRITATARRMGITAIAVYSEADRNARHVREADEAYLIGPAAAAQSYLSIAQILEAARRAKADAIHPGYGFLSENAEFAQACVDSGFLFVGPAAAAMRAMGSKSAAKSAMAAAGVPVAPGYHGDDQSTERLLAEAERVGYPLIVKASAGGGGKGMQVVHGSAGVAAAIESAQRLARTAFGDARLLLERYVVAARHVEVQVFADTHGNAVTLQDRDCSVQRRHQKVVEEAPAPGLRADVRAAMAGAALTVAREIGYVGAGTIEFLLDADQEFYFMEMNTRLQVEHPVTEMINRVDLVEWQLRAARGEALSEFAPTLAPRGAAVEVRLYAEDPAHDYLPSVGEIAHLRWPSLRDGVRLDAGVDQGDSVSSFYDPMLGKIIAWGDTRVQAIDRLAAALSELEIAGVTTNRALLLGILRDETFRAGAVSTDFLIRRANHLSLGEPQPQLSDLAAAGLWCATQGAADGAASEATSSPWGDSGGWRLAGASRSEWRFGEHSVIVAPRCDSGDAAASGRATAGSFNGEHSLMLDGQAHSGRVVARSADSLQFELEQAVVSARVIAIDGVLHVYSQGRHSVLRSTHAEDTLQVQDAAAQGSLTTPLPGTVTAVLVKPGQAVAEGQALLTVEAMKMEHTLRSPRAGTVQRVAFAVGERVPEGAVLVELDDVTRPESAP